MPRSRSITSMLPPLLTAFVLVLGGVLALVYPWRLVLFYFTMLPVPLTVLWASRNVSSPAERIATVDAQHAM